MAALELSTFFEMSKSESHCPNLNMTNLTLAITDSLFISSQLMSNMYSLVSALELRKNQLIGSTLVELEKISQNGKWCMKGMKFPVIHSFRMAVVRCSEDFAMQKQAFAWFWILHIAKVRVMSPLALFYDIEVCYNILKIFRSVVHCNVKLQKPRSPPVIIVPLRAIKYSSFRLGLGTGFSGIANNRYLFSMVV